jgi:hypothetical protein
LKVCSAGDIHVYEHINNIRQYALFHGHNDLLDCIMSIDHICTQISTKQEGHDCPEVAHLYVGPRSGASLNPRAFI